MSTSLNVEDILALLPHRYPMMLVDRVLEMEPGKRVVGLKNVSYNEPFFAGHFPGQPVMPGVLILEAMAQVAGLMMLTVPNHEGKLTYLGGIDKGRFTRPVVPGDTLITEAELLWLRGDYGRVRLTGRVAGEKVAEAEMTFAIKDRMPSDQVRLKLDRIIGGSNGRSTVLEGVAEPRSDDPSSVHVDDPSSQGDDAIV